MSNYSYEDEASLTDALITTRDGIVGRWEQPKKIPAHLPAETDINLAAWQVDVRDTLFAFELTSRIGFSAEPATQGSTDRTVSVWHLKTQETAGAAPTATYQRLVKFDRPSEAAFHEQLAFLRAYADLRPDRATEIIEQLASPIPYLGAVGFLRADARRWTVTLLEVALDLARHVEHRVKHALACRRPIEYSPQVQPIIETPGHGSLPSGHATEAFLTALVLRRLLAEAGSPYELESYGEQFMRLASRIAVNRTVAGVHFPVDSVAGALLGLTLGDYFLARLGVVDHAYQPAHFDGAAAGVAGRDFQWREIYDVAGGQIKFAGPDAHPAVKAWGPAVDLATDPADTPSAPLAWLWRKAREEWT